MQLLRTLVYISEVVRDVCWFASLSFSAAWLASSWATTDARSSAASKCSCAATGRG